MKSWYLIVKIFGIVYSTLGPYPDKDSCIKDMIAKYDEGMSAYRQGQHLTFMGLDVKPKNVKGQCQQK